jgi:aerobic-type carbon monoxide dehydrogenase small subunit (CoxS/CutS family)
MRHEIRVRINGIEYRKEVEARRLLVDFLREDLNLTGTHIGCEHGRCGSCTVLMNGWTVRSCLVFAVQADNAEIVTVEGLAQDGRLNALQQAFTENFGLQCGFCTPGMLMAATELLQENPQPDAQQIKEALSGVLCRCTGYQQIIRSVAAAAENKGIEPEQGLGNQRK